MITEDYVSFNTAMLLKENGFNEEVKAYYIYDSESEICDFQEDDRWDTPNDWGEYYWSVPTLQMAMKWLREEHNLVITVSIGNENNKGNTDYSNPDRWFYFFDITNEKGVVIDTEYDPLSNEFPTYEQACETAIKYCLENLI